MSHLSICPVSTARIPPGLVLVLFAGYAHLRLWQLYAPLLHDRQPGVSVAAMVAKKVSNTCEYKNWSSLSEFHLVSDGVGQCMAPAAQSMAVLLAACFVVGRGA